jgi:hypothetical protein
MVESRAAKCDAIPQILESDAQSSLALSLLTQSLRQYRGTVKLDSLARLPPPTSALQI